MVVRIGGSRVSFSEASEYLLRTLQEGIGRSVVPLDNGSCSEIVGRQTDSFRPGTKGRRVEYDFRYCIT